MVEVLTAEHISFEKRVRKTFTLTGVAMVDMVSGMKAIRWLSKNIDGRLVGLNASQEIASLYFEANLLAHISSHVVNSSKNGFIKE